jgi:hypothetical protein
MLKRFRNWLDRKMPQASSISLAEMYVAMGGYPMIVSGPVQEVAVTNKPHGKEAK